MIWEKATFAEQFLHWKSPLQIPNNRGWVLKDTFWSPWLWPSRSNPWPRSLQVLKNALFLAEDIELLKMGHGHELFSLYLGNWHFFARRPFFFVLKNTLSIPVLGLEKSVLGLGFGFVCIIGLGFERCVLDSTSVLDK